MANISKRQLTEAKKGVITPEMARVAQKESLQPETIRAGIADGTIVITKNNRRDIEPLGIGRGLSTKINANIGTSADEEDLDIELEKLEVAQNCGADAIMDLSTGGDLRSIRQKIIARAKVPIGTVPIYQTACENVKAERHLLDMTADEMFRTIEHNAEDGVDFITVHCGVTRESVRRLNTEGRLLDIVSRGGAILAKWMDYHDTENPLFEQYDRLLDIAREYDMTLSLGDGLRPGCLSDATDRGQVQETIILGELAERAMKADVQVMIEGPGHMPINQITANIQLQKRLCHGAPFYVLGPLVTDIAPGYDHITSAIGGAIAGSAGADFLCYVTPAEHLRLPGVSDVREGVIASKIAAHAADIAKNVPGAIERDHAMARARKRMDWAAQRALSLDPEKFREYRESSKPADDNVCTMCASLCSIKVGQHL